MWFHLPWHAVEGWIIKMHESFSSEPNQELWLFSDLKPGSQSDFCFQCTVSTRCLCTYFPLDFWDEDLPGASSLWLPLSAVFCSLRQLCTAQQEWCPVLEKCLKSKLGWFSLQVLGTGKQTEISILSQTVLATSEGQIMQKMINEAAVIGCTE